VFTFLGYNNKYIIVKKLTISNFRNYENANIEFKKALNVIIGKNAQK
jgi:DNA replication and repair protein RecF